MSEVYCAEQILGLASGIYADIGAPPSQSVGYISGWLVSSGSFLGDLNNRASTCVYVSGDAPCLVNFNPALGSIANLIYQANYFKVAWLAVLQGGAQWTQLTEGDSKISREATTNIAKLYKDAHKDADDDLKLAIHYYTLNQSIPQGIDGVSLYSWPSP